jgi:hypothetical protein
MVIVNLLLGQLNLSDKGKKVLKRYHHPNIAYLAKPSLRGWIQGQRAYNCHKGKAKLDAAKTGIHKL